MAFLELDQNGVATNFVGSDTVGGDKGLSVAAAAFTRLEWTVVGLARHDSIRTFACPGIVDRLLTMLLGEARDASLANPRLEALRRTTLAVRCVGRGLPGDVAAAFHAAGFNRRQLDILVDTVAADLSARRPERFA